MPDLEGEQSVEDLRAERGEPVAALPLVVDLDGTLIANDLLLETASRHVSRHPGRTLRMLGWARRGPAVLKHELWSAAPVDVHHLRYHEELLQWLREERERGRTLVLASASDERAVRAVADHLGLFDEAIGSDGATNLRSEAKAEALVARFGERGFEYVGNHAHDRVVWERSAAAHVVSARRSVLGSAERAAAGGRVLAPEHRGLRAWVRALRPHQWVKNLLILLPLLTAQRADDVEAVGAALVAFASFCLVASSVYLLNDLVDLDNDRRHPTKRDRPFASGAVSLLAGWAAWPVLALAGLGIGAAVSWAFAGVLAAYLAVTVAYSFALKRRPILDVLTLAGLYTVRIVAGAVAIDVALSMWLLSFSGFFFLSLALVKRVSELSRARATNSAPSGRGYQPDDLELLSSFGVATSVTSALVFTLFVNDPTTAVLYESPRLLWFSVPLILGWLMRVWLYAHRGRMNEDPIVFAIRDRPSLVAGLLVVAVFATATLYSG